MTDQAQTRLFAVIVHFNNWPDVLDTVSDAIRDGVPSERIVVVDNGSPPEAGPRAKSEFPGLRWLSGHGNVGYGAALNMGARIAEAEGADYLLALTHEVRTDPGTLETMLSVLQQSPRAAAVGPRLRRKSDPTQIWSEGGRFNRLTCLAKPVSRFQASTVDWLDGCCFIAPMDLFSEVGGVFEPYFLYMEEVDLFQRFRACGREILVSEGAFALQEPGHMGMYLATRNRILLSRRVGYAISYPFVVTEIALRLARGVLLHPRRDRTKNSDRLRGLVHGVRMAAK